MNNVILTTAYFPNIQYFSKLIQFDNILIEAKEYFQKQSFRNRCYICGANGLQALSVPLEKHTAKTPIQDIRIAYHEAWQRNHWRSIKSAYKNSPFFEHYEDQIIPFFEKNYKYLFEMNQEILLIISDIIELKKTPALTSEYMTKYEQDWRTGIHPKTQYQKQDNSFKPAVYYQVFSNKNEFMPNMSILDLLFCEGRSTFSIIKESVVYVT